MIGHVRLLSLSVMCALLAGNAIASPTAVNAAPPAALQFIIGDNIILASPDVTTAANGKMISMTGHGILSATGRAAEGFGSYIVTNSSGSPLSVGTWTVRRAETTFVSFGTLAGLPPGFQGGRILLEIQFQDLSQHRFFGELLVTCLVGSPPPGAQEGVHVRSPALGTFNNSVSGQTLFIQQL